MHLLSCQLKFHAYMCKYRVYAKTLWTMCIEVQTVIDDLLKYIVYLKYEFFII
jgi:hypothetical protein